MTFYAIGAVALAVVYCLDRYQKTHVRTDPDRLEAWARWTERQGLGEVVRRRVIGTRTPEEIKRYGVRGVSERAWREREVRLEAARARYNAQKAGRKVVAMTRRPA